MQRRSRWVAPAALLAIAALLLTLTLSRSAAAGPHAADAAVDMPFRQALPQIAADSASGTGKLPGASTTPTVPANSCGSGHDSLVNFTDPAAAAIPRDPQEQALSFLRTRTRPATLPAGATRTGPVETTVYKVSVVLQSMTLLPNHALQLVVADPTFNTTMLVTLPDQSCTGAAVATDQGAMNNARTALRISCGDVPASGTTALAGTATLTGAGFWGPQNAEDAAQNGIELAPLLGFEFTGFDCDASHATPTPSPTPIPIAKAITIGNSGDPGPVAPGGTIVATLQTIPPVPGVTCSVTYVSPPVPPAMNGTISNDPALIPKQTDSQGTITWTWTIPADSQTGRGALSVHCGQVSAGVPVHVG